MSDTNQPQSSSEELSTSTRKEEDKPISTQQLVDALSLTIKRDDGCKLLTFLAMLSAYTEDSQLNITFMAPSSTGKSYIPLEVANLFPKEDVIELAYASPASFYHSKGVYDKDKKIIVLDLSKKQLILLDQMQPLLLQNLRPLLSHDRKELVVKIADKNQRRGLETKEIHLIGYPAVIFCTANLEMDEQESTRSFILSPEITPEKISEGIHQKVLKESDRQAYEEALAENPLRKMLIERIAQVKAAGIKYINLPDANVVEARFLQKNKALMARHQRDVSRLCSLVKLFALFNFPFRRREGDAIFAKLEDIDEAFILYDLVSGSGYPGIPPYVYSIFTEIILPTWNEILNKDELGVPPNGLSLRTILDRHYRIRGYTLNPQRLNTQILPVLDHAGLISIEKDETDRRRKVIFVLASE